MFQIGRSQVLLHILHGTKLRAVEFFTVQNWALWWSDHILHGREVILPSSARNSTLYNSGPCRFLLDILRITLMGAVEVCSTFCMVENWLLYVLQGKKVGAFESFSTFYMVQKCLLSSSARTFYNVQHWTQLIYPRHFEMLHIYAMSNSARHSTWYRSGRSRVMLDILHGKNWVLSRLSSTSYVVQKWPLSSSARHSTWYRIGGARILLYILRIREVGASGSCSTFYMLQFRSCWVLLVILNCTEVRAVEFCSTFFILQTWALSSSARYFA